jgi:hypothetical protein
MLKENYGDDFEFFEFIDQYDELLARQPNRKLFGIGVAVKKSA